MLRGFITHGRRSKTMRRFLLAGASLLALLAGSPAEAATLMFGYTGTIVPYVVPETGTYQIIAWGAEGVGSPGAAVGGLGAEIGGETELLANSRLEILVGQMGASGKEKYAGGGAAASECSSIEGQGEAAAPAAAIIGREAAAAARALWAAAPMDRAAV
jgi:Glycine rich protein